MQTNDLPGPSPRFYSGIWIWMHTAQTVESLGSPNMLGTLLIETGKVRFYF